MYRLRILVALLVLPLFVAGCASSGGLSRQAKCALIGAAVGGVGGAVAASEAGAGGTIGALGGAILGGIYCDSTGDGDSDGDGVPDSMDKCPNTPAGAAVDRNGCPLDTDGDGVPDYKDECATPAGVKVDERGCSIDSDGDGVPDADDQCPGTPPGTKVDEFGCGGDSDGDGVPDHKDKCPNTPRGWKVNSGGCPLPIVFRNVTFAFDSAALSAEARKTLDAKAVTALKDNPAVRVKIIGHTDSIGSDGYNQGLSERRAQSVAKYLSSKGIASSRLMTEGRGESDPVAPNSVSAGRAANRRVEMFATQ